MDEVAPLTEIRILSLPVPLWERAREHGDGMMREFAAERITGTRVTGVFDELPISLYDGHTLYDAWGNPIVFMSTQHPAIGMAPLKAGDEEH